MSGADFSIKFSTVQNLCSVPKYDKKPLFSQSITLDKPIIVLLSQSPSDLGTLIGLAAQETDVFHHTGVQNGCFVQ